MPETSTRRLLVVANLTESAPHLLEEIERRARDDCEFTLMVPPERHPDAPDWEPDDALRLSRGAAKGRSVTLGAGGGDAAAAFGPPLEGGGRDGAVLGRPVAATPPPHRH